MKQRYWLVKRRGIYYLHDCQTGTKDGLQTRNKDEAQRIRNLKNEALRDPTLNLIAARSLLKSHDQKMARRTWTVVMEEMATHGRESTRLRCQREIKSRPFNLIRDKPLIETTSEDLLNVLKLGKSSTNNFLGRFHNLALGFGWIPWPILRPKLWPRTRKGKRRGITRQEYERIIAAEQNVERRLYYQLLWEIGSSQTDAAKLTAENIDWKERTLICQRQKLAPDSKPAMMGIGASLEKILRQLPSAGSLFEHISKLKDTDRSAEFYRRCKLLGIRGVSLHSFRYSWAERAKTIGYPQRWAEEALGHASAAIHHVYAKGARIICPSLEDYEKNMRVMIP